MGAFEDYQKARGKSLHPETEGLLKGEDVKESQSPEIEQPIKPTPWYKKIDWFNIGKWIIGILVVMSLLYGGVRLASNITSWVSSKEVEPVKEEIEVQVPVGPEIIYKDRIVYKTRYKTKWKTRIKVVEKPVTKVIYRDRPVYIKTPSSDAYNASLLAVYRRRLKMMQDFYSKPLKPGERRVLTFESKCPSVSFDNSMKPYQNLGLNVQ